jgi:hypothetical protein
MFFRNPKFLSRTEVQNSEKHKSPTTVAQILCSFIWRKLCLEKAYFGWIELNLLHMTTVLLIAATLILAFAGYAQDKEFPYRDLPSYPPSYSAGAVASRVVDGLGFRFYWATEGLRPQDLEYKPSPEARTCVETIEHIYQMSFMILNATTNTVNVPGQAPARPFEEMRRQTLVNLKTASERLRSFSDTEMDNLKVISKRGDSSLELPFWNMLNGPIADCLWHTGQIVSFRRGSGNPFSAKVNVFTGTVRE